MSTTQKQTAKTIKQALAYSPSIRRALNQLVGCPSGGWGETMQALRDIDDALPSRSDRNYSRNELIDAAMKLDHADRYQWRQ